MDARWLKDEEMIQSAAHSKQEHPAEWREWADQVLVF